MTSHRDDVVLRRILHHHDVTSLKTPLKNPAYTTGCRIVVMNNVKTV